MLPQKRHTSASAYPCIRCAIVFATHLLEQKEDIRVIQVLPGPPAARDHLTLYPGGHPTCLRKVISPLDRLPSE